MSNNISFFDHLEELRWHIIRSLIFIIISTSLVFFYTSFIFNEIIFGPLKPSFWSYKFFCKISNDFCVDKINIQLISTEISGQFYIHLKVAFMLGIVLSIPYIIWEIWRFIKPALQKDELSFSIQLFFYGFLLLFIGIFFGYYIIFPVSFLFMINYTIDPSIQNMPSILNYFENLSDTVMWSGVMFELPIMLYFLAKIGIVNKQFLIVYRRHLYLLILILAAAITPSADILSQFMVAIPLVLLYESSIYVVAIVEKKSNSEML